MVGVQEFYGTGASQSYADRATDQINDVWSGKTKLKGEDYTVDCQVTGRYRDQDAPPNPMANQIQVVQSTQPREVTDDSDPPNQPLYGQGPGYQHSDDLRGRQTAAHEFGHSMGLDDEYKEGPRRPDGKRGVTFPCGANDTMCHSNQGNKPTPANYDSLITGKGLAE